MDLDQFSKEAVEKRKSMASDPHRPQYHFQSPSNWVNDAHPIYWNGEYHMFYLYNPYGVTHGIVHWAHAVSEDLVHWRDLPIAMSPDTVYDNEGVRSGNVFIDDDGIPTAIYTGTGLAMGPGWRGRKRQAIRQYGLMAKSTDGMVTWKKHSKPIMDEPPYPGTRTHHDAQIWKDDDTWYQLVGGSYRGNGAALLHSSQNLEDWKYVGRVFTGENGDYGDHWELPYLLPFGSKHVMIIGIGVVPYFVGTYDSATHTFTPEYEGILDYGIEFYAPNPHMTDDKGVNGSERRLMVGWICEPNESPAPSNGWNGMFSIPRVVTLLPDNTLGFEPVPELQSLRKNHREFHNVSISETPNAELNNIYGDSLEIKARFEIPADAGTKVGFKLRKSVDGREETRIIYDMTTESLIFDPLDSSLLTGHERMLQYAPLPLKENRLLDLHIFLDHSVIEIYANKTVCLTGRTYPSLQDSLKVEVFSDCEEATLQEMKVWDLSSIW